jgi:hypothetical protein
MNMNRRTFVGLLIAAPAVIRVPGLLMPVKKQPPLIHIVGETIRSIYSPSGYYVKFKPVLELGDSQGMGISSVPVIHDGKQFLPVEFTPERAGTYLVEICHEKMGEAVLWQTIPTSLVIDDKLKIDNIKEISES